MNAINTPGLTRDDEVRATMIARRAYEKWQARGCPHGDDRRDWFEAEAEIAGELTAPVYETKGRSTAEKRECPQVTLEADSPRRPRSAPKRPRQAKEEP